MLRLPFLESVTERDIDLLLLEEFSVNEDFRNMLSALVFGKAVYKKYLGAWHSVCSDNLGETDLLFLFESTNELKLAILIENKINALTMPQQGIRYRKRGEKGIKNGLWDKFKTCISAPQKYLSSVFDVTNYDCTISYENIYSYFSLQANNNRYLYKANVILEGIEQNRRGYQPIENEKVTEFFRKYFDYASEKFPLLKMQDAKSRQAGSSWVEFYPNILPPEGVSLAHQVTNGEVKLLLKGQANNIEKIREKYHNSLSERMFIKKAGQSVAIFMRVPKIFPVKNDFDKVIEIIDSALDCLLQLSILYEKYDGI